MTIIKKNATIKAVRKVLVQHYISKSSGDITEDDIIEAEETANLLMDHLFVEVWDLNKERISEEKEKEYNDKLKNIEKHYSEKLLKAKKDLENESEKQKTLTNFKSTMTLIIEGIIIASVVGIIVNQITELLEILKLTIFKFCGLPIWITTLSIIAIGIVSIIIILIKKFLNKFGRHLEEIYKPKNDTKIDLSM